MSKKKIRRQLWWLKDWQLDEQESWLEEMSAEGWHLVKTGIGRATFAAGEPRELRYRCDVFKAGDLAEQERLELYEDAGWEHVANRGLVQIFRAPADASIPEIHTDPELQAKNIRRLLPEHIFTTLFALLILPVGALLYRVGLAELLISADWTFLVTCLFFFAWAVFHVVALVNLVKHIRRIERKQPPQRALPWRKQKRRQQVRDSLLILALISIFSTNIIALMSKEQAFPPIPAGDLPLLRLADIMQADDYAHSSSRAGLIADKGDVFNYYKVETSLLVPEQHYLVEARIIPPRGGSEHLWYTLHFDVYRAVSPNVAEMLAKSLAKKRSFRFHPFRSSLPLPLADESRGFDSLRMLEDAEQRDLIVRQNNFVYYLSYTGKETLEQLITTLQTVVPIK